MIKTSVSASSSPTHNTRVAVFVVVARAHPSRLVHQRF
jgi:hypothetical protein